MPIIYHDGVNVSLWGLENVHPFDTKKYQKIASGLRQSGVGSFIQPRRLTMKVTPMLEPDASDRCCFARMGPAALTTGTYRRVPRIITTFIESSRGIAMLRSPVNALGFKDTGAFAAVRGATDRNHAGIDSPGAFAEADAACCRGHDTCG